MPTSELTVSPTLGLRALEVPDARSTLRAAAALGPADCSALDWRAEAPPSPFASAGPAGACAWAPPPALVARTAAVAPAPKKGLEESQGESLVPAAAAAAWAEAPPPSPGGGCAVAAPRGDSGGGGAVCSAPLGEASVGVC